MGPLKALAAGLLLAVSTAVGAQGGGGASSGAVDRLGAPQIDRWSPHIREASARFGIPEEWIRRVMRAESGGRTTFRGRPITSPAGAMGLMQLMPGTWAEMRTRHGLGPDPHDPRDNILAGTAYLRAMYDRFGYPSLFAAYNAGPQRYARHIDRGHKLPEETIAYMARVAPGASETIPTAREPAGTPSATPAATGTALFAVRRRRSEGPADAVPSAAETLFAVRSR